jgi:hypothetical protein
MVAKKKKVHVIEAMTPSQYAKIRDPYVEMIKESVANEESYGKRQARLYLEEMNRKKNESLADE